LRWGTERQQERKEEHVHGNGETIQDVLNREAKEKEDLGRTGKEANDDEKGTSKERN
jgi:hypothetical protein